MSLVALTPGTYAGQPLDPVQAGWAQKVIDAAYTAPGVTDRDVVCALACARQESEFYMYANDGTSPRLSPEQQAAIKASLAVPHDKVGNNSASVGLFQQQPFVPGRTWGWGTNAQCMDAAHSTGSFMAALLRLPNRPTTPVTVLVQAVQRSAYPDAYAPHETLAWALLAAYWHDRAATSAGGATPAQVAAAVTAAASTVAAAADMTPVLAAADAVTAAVAAARRTATGG